MKRLFAQILATPDARVRHVFFPRRYQSFEIIHDVLTGIQSVPGQDNSVRISQED